MLDFSIIIEAWPVLLSGMGLTFLLLVASLAGAVLLGTVLAAMRMSR